MDDIIARIKHKLAYLQQHDDGDVTEASQERKWQIEDSYPYHLQPPHTEKDIAKFEAKHEIRLPDDYRQFLLEVGSSGVGPLSALYSPITQMATPEELEALDEKDTISDDEALPLDALPLIDLNLKFLFTEPTIDAYEFVAAQGFDDVDMHRGQITLSEYGGGTWHGLIITGKCRGEMWYLESRMYRPIQIRNDSHFELNPDDQEQPMIEPRITFTQWYEAWLNRQIRIAQEHWHKRGRTVPPLMMD